MTPYVPALDEVKAMAEQGNVVPVYREVVTDPPQLVVPSTRAQPNRAIGEVGVLVGDQTPDQTRSDLDPDVGHAAQR